MGRCAGCRGPSPRSCGPRTGIRRGSWTGPAGTDDLDHAVQVADRPVLRKPGALLFGRVLDPGEQGPTDPVERVVLVAPPLRVSCRTRRRKSSSCSRTPPGPGATRTVSQRQGLSSSTAWSPLIAKALTPSQRPGTSSSPQPPEPRSSGKGRINSSRVDQAVASRNKILPNVRPSEEAAIRNSSRVHSQEVS